MADDCCPIKSLREEVARFKATNMFTPLEVTNFYIQAGLVLRTLDDLAMLVARLSRPNASEQTKADARDYLRRRGLAGSPLRGEGGGG